MSFNPVEYPIFLRGKFGVIDRAVSTIYPGGSQGGGDAGNDRRGLRNASRSGA